MKVLIHTLLITLLVIAFIYPVKAEFIKTDEITVKDGFIADNFSAKFEVNSGKKGISFYQCSWMIENSEGSLVYRYWKRNPVKQTGPLSQLVLGPGKYYVYVEKGSNKEATLKINYDFTDNSLKRYALPSNGYGYTVYDFDKEEFLYFSGDCGYFKVKDYRRPYLFVNTPSYIILDDKYNPLYFRTPKEYYIFDGKNNAPILIDKDDTTVIVDDGDGKLIIVENQGI